MNVQQKALIESLVNQGKGLKDIEKVLLINGIDKEQAKTLMEEYQSVMEEEKGVGYTQVNPASLSSQKSYIEQVKSMVGNSEVDPDPEQTQTTEVEQPPSKTEASSQPDPIQESAVPNNTQRVVDRFEAAAPSEPEQQPVSTEVVTKKKGSKLIFFGFIAFLLLVIGGVGAFAYVNKIGPFAIPVYAEDNFMRGLAQSFAGITSAETKFLLDARIEERDADAKVYKPVRGSETFVEDYKEDYKRVEVLKDIMWNLPQIDGTSYPEVYLDLYGPEGDIKPGFEYQVTEEGDNFAITVEFLTEEMINEIKSVSSENTLLFEGNKMIITKDSRPYLWVPATPPLTIFEQMSESVAYLSPQFTTYGSISLASDWTDLENTEGLFRLEGQADLGDLSFKVDLEGRKKASRFFGRINNLPEIPFIGAFLPEKGKWLYFDLEEDSEIVAMSTGANSEEVTAEIEKQKKNAVEMARKAIELSDSHRVFKFKNDPYPETIGDKKLVRYDLDIDREALIKMYKDLKVTLDSLEGAEELATTLDSLNFLESVESEEFINAFNYFKENYDFTVWTDQDLRPVRFELSGRVIPSESATRLEGKQLRTTFTILLNNVNQPVVVETPAASQSLDEFTETLFGESLMTAKTKGQEAYVKASLSGVRAQAELFYDGNANSYGTAGASCSTADSLFTDEYIASAITSAETDNGPGSISCANTPSSWVLYSPLNDSLEPNTGYCVDSTGFADKIIGKIENIESIVETDLCSDLI